MGPIWLWVSGRSPGSTCAEGAPWDAQLGEELAQQRQAEADDAGGTGGTLGSTSSTTVWFADIDDDEIDAYIATGEPLHVAGAFTIDGLGGAFVTGLEGDHHTVVGVSLPLLRELLAELGHAWTDLWSTRA